MVFVTALQFGEWEDNLKKIFLGIRETGENPVLCRSGLPSSLKGDRPKTDQTFISPSRENMQEKSGYQQENSAFSLQIKEQGLTPQALYRHLESYLGEYRFQLPIYSYSLHLENGVLIDPETREPMIVKAQRAIEKRKNEGKDSSREEAEFTSLSFLGENLKPNDTFIWVSPPGEKEEGYGPYGFFFIGQVDQFGEKVTIQARRADIENYEFEEKDFSKFREALSEIVGEELKLQSDQDFLNTPFILKSGQGAVDPEKIISKYFGPIDWQKLQEFSEKMNFLKPLIEEFIRAYYETYPQEYLEKLLNTIENLAVAENLSNKQIDLNYVSLPQLIDTFGYTPPIVFGSCGSTSNSNGQSLIEKLTHITMTTPNIFSKLGFKENEDEYGSLEFKCPNCGEIHQRPPHTLLTHCPKTGKEIPKC